MKKNYLFTLAALLLGSTIANAQKPLDGYEAPSFTAPGNCGKVISLSTSGALENYTDLKDLTTGKIEQELFVAPGAKVEFSITNLENLPAGIYLAKVSMGENTTIIRFKK